MGDYATLHTKFINLVVVSDFELLDNHFDSFKWLPLMLFVGLDAFKLFSIIKINIFVLDLLLHWVHTHAHKQNKETYNKYFPAYMKKLRE